MSPDGFHGPAEAMGRDIVVAFEVDGQLVEIEGERVHARLSGEAEYPARQSDFRGNQPTHLSQQLANGLGHTLIFLCQNR
jgi:hypothetical protein